jgi:hypothetical protein
MHIQKLRLRLRTIGILVIVVLVDGKVKYGQVPSRLDVSQVFEADPSSRGYTTLVQMFSKRLFSTPPITYIILLMMIVQ